MAADTGEWQVVRRGRRRAPVPPPRAKQAVAYRYVASAASPTADRVSLEKQRALEVRVRRIIDELKISLLLPAAVSAISVHLSSKRLDIVAYGLGSFHASSNAVYQLAFLVALADALAAKDGASEPPRMELFDPVMTQSDTELAEQLGITVLERNDCGRRRVERGTVFFMPHCPRALYENVVAANWGTSVSDLVILGNSFTAYGDRTLDAAARREQLLLRVLPVVAEEPLPLAVDRRHADFPRFEAAFNDLSAMAFPSAAVTRAQLEDPSLGDVMERAAATTDNSRDKDELITHDRVAADRQE